MPQHFAIEVLSVEPTDAGAEIRFKAVQLRPDANDLHFVVKPENGAVAKRRVRGPGMFLYDAAQRLVARIIADADETNEVRRQFPQLSRRGFARVPFVRAVNVESATDYRVREVTDPELQAQFWAPSPDVGDKAHEFARVSVLKAVIAPASFAAHLRPGLIFTTDARAA